MAELKKYKLRPRKSAINFADQNSDSVVHFESQEVPGENIGEGGVLPNFVVGVRDSKSATRSSLTITILLILIIALLGFLGIFIWSIIMLGGS